MWKAARMERRIQWRDVHLGGRVYTRFRARPGSEAWTMVTVHVGLRDEHWWARAFR